MRNFQTPEVVDRGSETQLEVGSKWLNMILFSGHRLRVQTANTGQAMTFKEAAYDEVSNVDDKLYYIAVK